MRSISVRSLGTNIFVIAVLFFVSMIPINHVIAAPSENEGSDKALQEQVVAPIADQLLRMMGDFLKESEQFTFHAKITFDDLLPTGQKIQYAATNDVAVHRPDRIYAVFKGDRGNKRFWYDGKSITLLNMNENFYATKEIPARKIDDALDYIMEKLGFSPPLSDFASQDPYKILIENVQFGFYVGLHDVEGIACHHLAFVEKYIDWQVWIEDSNQLVPRKLVITYKTLDGSPQYTAIFSDWDLTARLPDSLFNADLLESSDFERIEFLKLKETITEKSK